MPPAAGGFLDYVQREKRGLVGPPFNGQARRLELIRDLIDRLRPDSIIETGTFRGSSTLVLAELIDGPVHTIEAFPRFYHFAKRRLRGASNVHVHLGDSAETLRRLAQTDGLSLSRAFIYLDAHSSELPGVKNVADELPLNRELKIIADKWSQSVILVDDFKISDDPGYGFDRYASGNLDLSYLDRAGMKARFGLFYPAARSSEESGARRGSLILTTRDQAEEIASSSSLLRRLSIG